MRGKPGEDTPCLSWHFQSLPCLQVGFCYIGDCDKARNLAARAKPALNSPLRQVILVKIGHLPESLLRRLTLLSPCNTGHPWLHLFCLALLSVNLIQAPHHRKNQVPGKGADKQNVKHGNSEAEFRMEWWKHLSLSQKYGINCSLDYFRLSYPFDTAMRWSFSTRWRSLVSLGREARARWKTIKNGNEISVWQ